MSEHVLTLHDATLPAGTPQAAMKSIAGRAGSGARKKWTIEYGVLFSVTFGVFLVAAIFESFLPFRKHAGGREGIIQRARFGAQTCVNYAFMG